MHWSVFVILFSLRLFLGRGDEGLVAGVKAASAAASGTAEKIAVIKTWEAHWGAPVSARILCRAQDGFAWALTNVASGEYGPSQAIRLAEAFRRRHETNSLDLTTIVSPLSDLTIGVGCERQIVSPLLKSGSSSSSSNAAPLGKGVSVQIPSFVRIGVWNKTGDIVVSPFADGAPPHCYCGYNVICSGAYLLASAGIGEHDLRRGRHVYVAKISDLASPSAEWTLPPADGATRSQRHDTRRASVILAFQIFELRRAEELISKTNLVRRTSNGNGNETAFSIILIVMAILFVLALALYIDWGASIFPRSLYSLRFEQRVLGKRETFMPTFPQAEEEQGWPVRPAATSTAEGKQD
jgi:hypothetical protein